MLTLKGRKTGMLALTLAAAFVGLAGCGGGGSDSQPGMRTVNVHGTKITIPADTSKEELLPVVFRAYYERLGYTRAFGECLVKEIAEKFPEDEFHALAENASGHEIEERGLELAEMAAPRCKKPGTVVVSPRATPQQLEILRQELARRIPLELPEPKFSRSQIKCSIQNVLELPDKKVLTIENGSAAAGEGVFAEAITPCFN